MTGMFQGMLLFFLLAADVLVRYRLRWARPAPPPSRDGVVMDSILVLDRARR